MCHSPGEITAMTLASEQTQSQLAVFELGAIVSGMAQIC